MKKCTFLCCLLLVLAVLRSSSAHAQTGNDLVVLVKYKTQPGKDSTALAEINKLITQVRKEPYYKNIIVHSDPADKSNILLYEQWSDAAYYKGDHMKTAHLQQFIKEAGAFLAGPPEITFWQIHPAIISTAN